MRRLASAALCSAVIVSLCIATVAMDARPSLGNEKKCTWGEIKCCYADPPCGDCCEKPKDEGTGEGDGDGAWLPAFLRSTLWPALRVLAG